MVPTSQRLRPTGLPCVRVTGADQARWWTRPGHTCCVYLAPRAPYTTCAHRSHACAPPTASPRPQGVGTSAAAAEVRSATRAFIKSQDEWDKAFSSAYIKVGRELPG